MGAPSPPAPPPIDPAVKQQEEQAQADLVHSLQEQTQGDMASLMARYGTQLAVAGVQMSPLTGKAHG